MKKIVFIHLFNDRSGSPKVLSQTIKAYQKKGYLTEVLTSSHTDGFLTDIADINRPLFYKRSENKLITLFYYIISQILLFFQCFKYWNKDVIFYINTMMPFGAALAAKIMRKKVIYHIHETSLKPLVLKNFLRKIISMTADKIVFVSKYLHDVESFANKPQVVIYNALESANNAQEKTNDKFVILMVCSLKAYKGVFEFITLAKFMSSANNLEFQLVLNAQADEIEDYLGEIEKPKNLVLFDRQSDLSHFYSNANLLLNLSRPEEWIETFGLTIVEGMEYGLPVIVPPVGGPVEIVRDGVDGFHVNCHKIEELAEKIMFFVEHKDEYSKFSKNSKERSMFFDLKVFEKNIVKVIEGLE
jgi:L-malate glycosyltransferase